MSLRHRLSVLVAIALTPPLLLTLYNTVRWQLVLEKEARDEVQASARLVSAEFAQIIEGSRQLMLAMSKHPAVPDQEAECTAYFKSVIADIPQYREAAVVDPEGKFHCSTIPIPPDLNVKDRIYFHEPLSTGQLTIGTLVQGRVTRSRSIHVSMPYKDASGAVKGIIVLILNPEKVAQDLEARPWQSGQRVIVLDREGSLVMAVPRDKTDEAVTIAQNIFPKIASAPAGIIDALGPDDRPEIVGFVPVHNVPKGLYVAVAVDRNAALAEASVINARSVAFALITMLLAIGGAWIATHFLINRPMRAIVATARLREQGDIAAPFPPLRVSTEFGQLSAALSRMSEKIQALLEQKSFLLRELQHRVMNSLTLLASVLDMQRRYIGNDAAREQLARARDRVVAMGTVYRFLYQTDTSEHVEFGSFLKVICAESQNAYGGPHKPAIKVTAEPLRMSGSHAIALAMLTHELITNALKHAYPEGDPGVIDVILLGTSDGGLELRVADKGRGVPEDFDVSQSGSLGMKVVASTTAQLGGSLEVNRLDPGTEFIIRLPAAILLLKGQVAA